MDNVLQEKPYNDSHSKNALRAWLQLLKCSKRMEQMTNSHLDKTFKSSLTRFDVLANLDAMDGETVSTTKLAKSLLASKGNITRLLDRMEEDQLITRKPNREDRRISDVFLADKGREEFQRMVNDHENWVDHVFSVLSNDEEKMLIETLGKLRRHLENTVV
ncbi:MarR family winged helix-turn-helix transcriptional regulator [Pseudoteredinibacter isoporae]|uniref:MarR family winged helix-turn-helix transcriptional regulator n=1 Tax=Pseudoteredinibacter isoporae TaxID=570281 RepID=UPI003104F15D